MQKKSVENVITVTITQKIMIKRDSKLLGKTAPRISGTQWFTILKAETKLHKENEIEHTRCILDKALVHPLTVFAYFHPFNKIEDKIWEIKMCKENPDKPYEASAESLAHPKRHFVIRVIYANLVESLKEKLECNIFKNDTEKELFVKYHQETYPDRIKAKNLPTVVIFSLANLNPLYEIKIAKTISEKLANIMCHDPIYHSKSLVIVNKCKCCHKFFLLKY